MLGSSTCSNASLSQETQPWSTVHKKIYSSQERLKNRSVASVSFKKTAVAPFTQLVVCWNAQRPVDGQFDIFLRVHMQGAAKVGWQPWFKIASWGDGVQKSYFEKRACSAFKYVRFEVNPGSLGDGFEVKLVGKKTNGSLVHAIFVCASNYDAFPATIEKPYWASKDLASVRVKGVSKKSQQLVDHPRVGALCSPTTLSMILQYLLHKRVDSLETARGVYDAGLDVFGSWPFNMAYAFEKSNKRYFFYVERLGSFAQLHNLLKSGPVGLSVRGPLKGGKTSYRSGHFLVVVGFDATTKKVICFDPAFDALDQVAVAYDIAEFLPAWERSNRIVYRAVPISN